MRLIKKLFIFVAILGLVLVIGGKVFIAKYGPLVEEQVMLVLKEQLTTELTLGGKPDITLFDDLPFVSAHFTDVTLEDATRLDTLLTAKSCFVRLNILKVIQGNYTISGIRVDDGSLNIKQDELGNWNYRVWKEPENSDGTKGFSLRDLELTNMRLYYDDKKADLNINADVTSGTLDASFKKGGQTLVMDLKGHLHSLTSGRDLELVDLPFGLAGVLDLNNADGIYSIDMGNALLAGNEMVWNGTFTRTETGTDMDISVLASGLRLESLLNRIWPGIPQNLKDLELSGKTDLQLSMKGQFTKNSGPETILQFDLKEGSMLLNGVRLTDIILKGTATTADLKKVAASSYSVSHFEVSTASGNSSGSFELNDLENPSIDLVATGTASLQELLALAKMDKTVSGTTKFNLKFKSPLGNKFKFTAKELAVAKLTGSIDLNNASFDVSNGVPQFRNINGHLDFSEKEAHFKNFSGELGSTGFRADLTLLQPKEVMTNDLASIRINGNAGVDRLDIDALVADWSNLESTDEGEKSRQITGEFNLNIDQLIYRKFTAEEISCQLKVENKNIAAHNLKMETMGGMVTGDLTFTQLDNGNHLLGIDADLQQINITRLFGEWNNFEQDFLKSEHLEGVGNAEILTSIELDKELNPIPEKIIAQAKLLITNGKLKEFEPLNALSKYIELDELKTASFDTLNNEISMANGIISIPNMTIKNNALELSLSGQHGLDNIVDYHVNMLLSDLLKRKAKKRKKEIEGHQIIEETGKTRLFLWIRGPLNDLKIGFDKKSVRKKLNNDLKKEGKLIKKLFQEEFGKKEKTTEKKEVDNMQFRLEDDGLENGKSETQRPVDEESKTEEPKKKKGGIFGWMKEQEEEKDKEEGGFEIEFD